MIKLKKLTAMALSTVMAFGLLAGCGDSAASSAPAETAAATVAPAAETAAAETAAPAAAGSAAAAASTAASAEAATTDFKWNGQKEVWSILPTTAVAKEAGNEQVE